MTLDEAIENLVQEIREFEGLKRIKAVTKEDYHHMNDICQLNGWLTELKIRREQKPCEDVIDRQAAIQHFSNIIETSSTKGEYNQGFIFGLEFAIGFLSDIPGEER